MVHYVRRVLARCNGHCLDGRHRAIGDKQAAVCGRSAHYRVGAVGGIIDCSPCRHARNAYPCGALIIVNDRIGARCGGIFSRFEPPLGVHVVPIVKTYQASHIYAFATEGRRFPNTGIRIHHSARRIERVVCACLGNSVARRQRKYAVGSAAVARIEAEQRVVAVRRCLKVNAHAVVGGRFRHVVSEESAVFGVDDVVELYAPAVHHTSLHIVDLPY